MAYQKIVLLLLIAALAFHAWRRYRQEASGSRQETDGEGQKPQAAPPRHPRDIFQQDLEFLDAALEMMDAAHDARDFGQFIGI